MAPKPVPGRPAALSDGQLAELAVCVRESTPAAFGFEQALWTRGLIADLIEQRFGVRLTADWVGKLMRCLGSSPQPPLYRASQQDPEAVETWREQVYPDIRAQAAQVGATVYFGDEAHLSTFAVTRR